jgi:hypothetical protein
VTVPLTTVVDAVIRRSPNDPSSFVYFLQRIPDGPIKIGWTDDPGRRVAELQTGSAEELMLRALIPGGRAEETQLHEKFASARMLGEWFRPVPELLAFIDTISTAT